MVAPWVLEDGLSLVRLLQPECNGFGYHIALGGSVLNEGRSDKDIDLYFLPLENDSPANYDGLLAYLRNMWGAPEDLGQLYNRDLKADFSINPFVNSPVFDDPGAVDNRILGRYSMPKKKGVKERASSVYKHQLKFKRKTDRIDVFVL